MENEKDIPRTEETENFSELMEEYSLKSIKQTAHVEGTIIDILDNNVIVDIGQKTEGILNKEELLDWDGKFNYKIGDNVTVACKNVNMKEGYLIVSKKSVDAAEGWKNISEAFNSNTPVKGKIIRLTEDGRGYKVDTGIEMFLPMTQVDIKRVKNPKSFIGQELEFKVVKLNGKDKSGILSRRELLEEAREKDLEKLYETLKEGDLIRGTVTRIEEYGAFVNLGAIDGLLHKDNISYGRIGHPREKLRKGDEIEVKVLSVDKENNRIALGIKQKYKDPWIDIEQKYPVGHRLIAKVIKTVDFGAFIELEEGIEGLLHISDLTWEGKPKIVEEYVAVGEEMWVQVIELDPKERKIKLGLKQLELRPEDKYMEKHSKGDIVKGTVKKVLKSRAFIELEKGIEGVIKISDICYFHIESPNEYLKEKEEIEAEIIDNKLDPNYKVRLGLKSLHDKDWDDFFASHSLGDKVEFKIKKITNNGIRCEISQFVEGFIRLGEIDNKRTSYEECLEQFKEGEVHTAALIGAEKGKKRIYLSFKELKRKAEKDEIEKYGKSENESATTIGDLFESALDKNK